jgi:hypothetical protein
MPDIFGNPTLQEMTQSRQKAFQGQIGDIMSTNMARALTGEEKAGVGVGSFLGALGAKYFGTPYAETAEGQAMAAKEAQLAGIMGKDYSNQNSNVSTPNGGMTTQSTPVPQIDATRAKAKAFMDYATQTNNPEAFKYALGLEQEVITLGKAQKEAQIKEDYVNTLPEDLKNLGRSANSDPAKIQQILEERNKKKDSFRILTKSEVAKQGLNPLINYQINEKNNDITEFSKIENNLGGNKVEAYDPLTNMLTTKDGKGNIIKTVPANSSNIKNADGTVTILGANGQTMSTVADPQAAIKEIANIKQRALAKTELSSVGNLINDARMWGLSSYTDREGNKQQGFAGAGMIDSALSGIPLMDSAKLNNTIESLKANLVVGTMKELKAASDTGSTGFGQVTEKELLVMQNLVATLDPSLGEENLANQLDKIQQHYDNINSILSGDDISTMNINFNDPVYRDDIKQLGNDRYYIDPVTKRSFIIN